MGQVLAEAPNVRQGTAPCCSEPRIRVGLVRGDVDALYVHRHRYA